MALVAKRPSDDAAGAPPAVHESADEVVQLKTPTAAGDPFVVVIERRRPDTAAPDEAAAVELGDDQVER